MAKGPARPLLPLATAVKFARSFMSGEFLWNTVSGVERIIHMDEQTCPRVIVTLLTLFIMSSDIDGVRH